MRNKKNKGFTLIELLIVIAIIGILAAVLIPNLLRARQVAVDRAAESYAKNVYTAGQAYLAESIGNTIAAAADCAGGKSFGQYSVEDPGDFITACEYSASVEGVEITYINGTTSPNTITIGNAVP